MLKEVERKEVYDIKSFTILEMTKCGKAMRKMGYEASSMEEAGRIVRYLYDVLVDGKTGKRTCSPLSGFLKLTPLNNLMTGLNSLL